MDVIKRLCLVVGFWRELYGEDVKDKKMKVEELYSVNILFLLQKQILFQATTWFCSFVPSKSARALV